MVMEMDGPLDFESENLAFSFSIKKKKRKAIGLDDLITDYYKEKNKVFERDLARKKSYKGDSDEECDRTGKNKEALLSKFVDECEKQVHEIGTDDEISLWGLQVFGLQKARPSPVQPGPDTCALLQSLSDNELNSLLGMNSEKGLNFLEGLLLNGWLSRFALTSGYLEDSIASWAFYLKSEGPPQNIRSWVRFLTACCQARNMKTMFLTHEVEYFLGVVINFFLDRKLLCKSKLLQECLLSVMSFFTDDEWKVSSEKVSDSLACRIPKDMNCLRIIECIPGSNTRSKHLRREIAFRILINCLNVKGKNAEEVLSSLVSIKIREKDCDFSRIYIYLVLTDKWLWSNPLLKEKPVLLEMWMLYLRNCSCQVTSTDWRPYASKVRNKASYLIQIYQRHQKQM
ncbi:uncharacterized protein LOC18426041 isoform X2 [Amborella trichopoda]|uniref:uncharacterized protein LOC18426041 isoform X2 n=1 Tax=Amborella trichopoda TaxID=13333 RepID=UPI0005D30EA0|nr:uncharacterized protein LOC18426041 isoform X2 [Amborella trichopoda]|eukprot:XP_011620361.1 uncharacterized protein LOC18426041 isoform X2 [Amborella trichopoda]